MGKKDFKTKQSVKQSVIKAKTDSKMPFYLGFILVVYSILLYVNTLSHGFVLDDASLITQNWLVKSGFNGIPDILKTEYRFGYWNIAGNTYRPLSLVAFASLWQVFPNNPFPFHLLNVLLYGLTALVLFKTLKRFTGGRILMSFLIVLLYISHPTHTEVVANIKSLDEILSFLFLLFSLNYLFDFVESSKITKYVWSVVFFFLAFLSKESTITWLAIFPLSLFLFSDKKIKDIAILMTAYFGVTILFLIMRKVALGPNANDTIMFIDNYLIAAKDPLLRMGTAIYLMGQYLLLAIYPKVLSSDYSFSQFSYVYITDWRVIVTTIILLSAAVFALIQINKSKILAFAIFLFFITMSLVSNIFILIGTNFADRFLYVPTLSFSILLIWLLHKFLKPDEAKADKALTLNVFFSSGMRVIIPVLVIVLFCSLKTFSRNKDWESETTLYTADIKNASGSARMNYYMGLIYMREKAMKTDDLKLRNTYLDSAIVSFHNAINIYPDFAAPYSDLGLAFFRKNLYDDALYFYKKALSVDRTKPETYSNMGTLLFSMKRYNEAIEAFTNAIKYNPRYADAYLNLGSSYGTIGQYDLAIKNFIKVTEYAPEKTEAWYYIAVTYKNKGDIQNAMRYKNETLKRDPSLKNRFSF